MASHAGLVSNCTCSHLPARRPLRLQSPACNASQRLSSTFVSQPVSSSCSSLSGTTLHSRSLAARPSQRPQRKVTSMAAKVVGMIKLALQAGKANPAPPVGPALGSKGVNIMQFCKSYNAATQDKIGTVIPVEITVFDDRSFTFILKTPPASVLLQKAAGVPKGSGQPNSIKVGKISKDQLREIATTKLPDLNTTSVDAAMNIVAGTARNMGITISE